MGEALSVDCEPEVFQRICECGMDRSLDIVIVDSPDSQDRYIEARAGDHVVDLESGYLYERGDQDNLVATEDRVNRVGLNTLRSFFGLDTMSEEDYSARDDRVGYGFYESLCRLQLLEEQEIIAVQELPSHGLELRPSPSVYRDEMDELTANTYNIDLSSLAEDHFLRIMVARGVHMALIDMSVISDVRIDVPDIGVIAPIILITPEDVIVFAFRHDADIDEALHYYTRHTSRTTSPNLNQTVINKITTGEIVVPVRLEIADIMSRLVVGRVQDGFPPVLSVDIDQAMQEEEQYMYQLRSFIIGSIFRLRHPYLSQDY